jgi:hypothetical protein
MLAGGFLVYEGVQMLTPLAEDIGLVSHVPTQENLVPQTLLSVAPSNYTFIPVSLQSGVAVSGAFQVADSREIAFYVMDEGNFSMWRAGHPSAVVIVKPVAISYNFTFATPAAGTYYFIFDNQDTSSRRTVIFVLSTVEDTVVPNPYFDNAGYIAFALGIVLLAIGAKTGGPKRIREEVVRCKYCRAKLTKGETFCAKCGRSQQ